MVKAGGADRLEVSWFQTCEMRWDEVWIRGSGPLGFAPVNMSTLQKETQRPQLKLWSEWSAAHERPSSPKPLTKPGLHQLCESHVKRLQWPDVANAVRGQRKLFAISEEIKIHTLAGNINTNNSSTVSPSSLGKERCPAQFWNSCFNPMMLWYPLQRCLSTQDQQKRRYYLLSRF